MSKKVRKRKTPSKKSTRKRTTAKKASPMKKVSAKSTSAKKAPRTRARARARTQPSPLAAAAPAVVSMTREEARQQLNITVDLIPAENSNRPGTPLTALHVTIHNTDNSSSGANAKAHAKYLKGQDAMNRKVSWHYTVDDGVVYQSLPLGEVGWHAGTQAGNTKTIGIEICQNQGIDQPAANSRAALLTALTLRELNLALADNVRQHNHWSGKDCPMLLRHPPSRWSSFLKEVGDFYAAIQPG